MKSLYQITHSIADNDAKGMTGIGTIHRIAVTGNGADEQMEYGLLEMETRGQQNTTSG